jgi:hypothetical protein
LPTIALKKEIYDRMMEYRSYRVYCLTKDVSFSQCVKELLECWERNEKPEALKK